MWNKTNKILILAWLSVVAVSAAPLILDAQQGNLSASVSFELDSVGNLRVVLTNTSPADVLAPADVLTAVFFDIFGNPTLTPVSAVLGVGSAVLFGGTDPGGSVGGEWAYAAGLSGAPHGARHGISSVGLDLFGPPDLFPGTNLAGPASPNGLQYGITSAGDNPATGNTPVTGMQPLIQNAVVFTLGDVPEGFRLLDISNVSFQYGTDLSEPNLTTHTPEPDSVFLATTGFTLLGAGMLRRRLRKG
ncbi:MAG: PEP-CTERM sorting domain-containing protein [Acidobacteria bacterium]|nr:PEP-CTERM sorting domain-containing protein [Acidobacteriota bacterium]